jgi:NAD(P)-dependent dehydrogenase (short-subunit alcohol dehydrogenase family)
MRKQENRGTRAVLVTGSGSGIGRATALALADRGYIVFAGVRKPEDAKNLEKLGKQNLIPVCPLDMRKTEQIQGAREKIERVLAGRDIPGLYAIVNNAGGGFIAPLELMDLEGMRSELETRILGPIALLQTMLPLVRAGRGRILWIQTPSLMPIAFDASIHACDFAANCLSRTLQQELMPWGIQSIQIRCGGIRTPSVERSYRELRLTMEGWTESGKNLYHDAMSKTEKSFREFDKKRSEPELVAKTVLTALEAEKPKRRYHAGYMSGISAWMECMPQPLVDRIMAKRQ